MAAACVHAGLSAEGGDELGAMGMVFHGGGFSLGVGEHLALGVDDGGASSGGLAFLGSDVLQVVLAVGINPVREENGFLGEIALDFLAQLQFPGAPDGKVESDGSGKNDEDKKGQQLEENPISHLAASNR